MSIPVTHGEYFYVAHLDKIAKKSAPGKRRHSSAFIGYVGNTGNARSTHWMANAAGHSTCGRIRLPQCARVWFAGMIQRCGKQM